MIDTNISSPEFDRLSLSAFGLWSYCLLTKPEDKVLEFEDLLGTEEEIYHAMAILFENRFLSVSHSPVDGDVRYANIFREPVLDPVEEIPFPARQFVVPASIYLRKPFN